jgi:Zn-finger nucleic acid-binding protein
VPLACPRCNVQLVAREVDETVTVDECATCKGVWIDGPELMTACRTLAHLPDRRGEVELTGRQGAGIAKCPRCESIPYEIRIIGEDVDFCTRCAGAWIDGGAEREAVGLTLERKRRVGKGGAYREVVDQSVSIDAIKCASCSERIPFKTTFATEEGFICNVCHAAVVVELAKDRAKVASHRGPITILADTVLDALAFIIEKATPGAATK